jgi:PBSX family phage portal protein
MAQVTTTRRIRRVRPATKITARATSIGGPVRRADTSRQMYAENEFNSSFPSAVRLAPITPPYDPLHLLLIIEQSNMLKQCITAYVNNVSLCGYDAVPAVDGLDVDPDEHATLQSFIDSSNCDESLAVTLSKVVENYEQLGYGFLEVIRDRRKRITIVRHCRASITRLIQREQTYSPVKYDIVRGPRIATVTELKQWRRFVQIVNGKFRYFKEFGDERRMHYNTGDYEASNNLVPDEFLATEILHFRQSSEDSYGVPRWINQLPNILGSREAEEVNLRYFEDNTIPPMILSVAGGRLTSESFKQLQRMLTQESLGRDRQHKMLLIEAVPERESLDDKGSVTLRVDKLADTRPSDGLFKEYDEGNQSKVRSSFRLPPVAVGLSQDVTFATANVSAFIAETQVYLPLRRIFDEILNKQLVNGPNGLGLKTCMLCSQVPAITNPQELIKSLTALNVMGALTPRMAQRASNRILEIELKEYPEIGDEGYEPWMDMPIIFVTKGTASQDGQSQKDGSTKNTEQTGNVGFQPPENGQQ